MEQDYTGYFFRGVEYSNIVYVCAKCAVEPYYYVTLGTYSEDGKLKVYMANIEEDREVMYFLFYEGKWEHELTDLAYVEKCIKRKIKTDTVLWNEPSLLPVELPQIEIRTEFQFEDALFWVEQDAFRIELPKKVFQRMQARGKYLDFHLFARFEGRETEDTKKRYDDNLFKNYSFYCGLPEEDRCVYSSQLIEDIKIKVHMLLLEGKKDTAYSYNLQCMRVLIRWGTESENEEAAKELLKEICILFIEWYKKRKIERQEFFKTESYYTQTYAQELNLWEKIQELKLQDILLENIIKDETLEVDDELLCDLISRWCDENCEIEIGDRVFKIKIKRDFRLSYFLFNAKKSRYDCNHGRYIRAEKDLKEIGKTFLNEWEILSQDDKKNKFYIKETAGNLVSSLTEVGCYTEATEIVRKKQEINSKEIYLSQEEYTCLMLGWNLEECEKFYSEQWRNILCLFWTKDFDEAVVRNAPLKFIFSLICIREISKLIYRKLVFSVEDKEKEKEKHISYYTSLNTFNYVLKDKEHKLKIMNTCYMNDAEEGCVLSEYIGIRKNQVQASDVFVKSFTLANETTNMWTLYGDNGKGCKIDISNEFFRELERKDADIQLLRMVYISEDGTFEVVGNPQDKKLSKEVKTLCEKLRLHIKRVLQLSEKQEVYLTKQKVIDIIDNETRLIRYLFKRDIFKDEKEVRILVETGEKYPIERIPDEREFYSKIALKLPVPLIVKNITIGPVIDEAIRLVPYIAQQTKGMLEKDENTEVKKLEEERFLREGVRYSELQNKFLG